jgi:hypothetical protein
MCNKIMMELDMCEEMLGPIRVLVRFLTIAHIAKLEGRCTALQLSMIILCRIAQAAMIIGGSRRP